jgi:DNA-binding LytR/AlgR family response regulator
MLKVLIIEDEPFAQQELISLLKETGTEIEVLDCLDSVADGADWLKSKEADLIFMDIQLSDGLSFEILRQVEIKTPVIFTTAFDQYAIKAFELNSIDYLLKPIELEALAKALQKFEDLKSILSDEAPQSAPAALGADQIERILDQLKPKKNTRLSIHIGDKITYIDLDEVLWFKADGKHVFAHAENGRQHLIDQTLEELNSKYAQAGNFFRISRSMMIRQQAIQEVHKYFGGRLLLKTRPEQDEQVFVARARVKEFLNWMESS